MYRVNTSFNINTKSISAVRIVMILSLAQKLARFDESHELYVSLGFFQLFTKVSISVKLASSA